jgi:hypothetical protein
MKLRIPLAVATAAATAVATVVVTSGPAGAADLFEMVGWAGGSIVRAADNTITSALTAASEIEGPKFQTSTNNAATINVADLISAGAVTTSTQALPIPGGVEVISHVKTADVSLLGGAIQVKAIDTTATATFISGVVDSDTSTTFVGATVGSTHIPITVPKNLDINIPNVARVLLNVTFTATQTGNAVMTEGAGLYVSLLKPRGKNAIGAEVILNPTYSAIQLQNPTLDHVVRGSAYGTRVTAAVGTLANIQSDPTAPITMPAAGTFGKTNFNTIASANLAPLLQVGAVTTSIEGLDTATALDARSSAEIAGINLFNGAITADAIKAVAHASGVPGNPDTALESDGSSTLVNLRIGGKLIPINTAPNTVINIANLAIVTINEIEKTPNAILVRVLDIKITTASYGLPVGAEIQIATATASVF